MGCNLRCAGSQEYRVVVTVMSPQQSYGADLRYTLRSRAWGTTTIGCSFKVKVPLHAPAHCWP